MPSESVSMPWSAQFDTMVGMFANAVRDTPNAVYCKAGEVCLTYGEAAGAMRALADGLGEEAKGRTVAVVLPNSVAFLIAYFGILLAGAKPALVNFAHPDATVAKLLAGMDIAAVLSSRDISGIKTTVFDDTRAAALAKPISVLEFAAKGIPTDIGAILFSGGTTGLPKQVPHSNAVLVSKVERMEWGWPTRADEVWLPVAPFTHVYGFLMGVLNPVFRAGSVVIPPKFQPDLIVDMLRNEKVTVFGGGPPAIYQGVMAAKNFANARFLSLRVCPGGGAPFPLDVHQRWADATGLPIHEGYGMTEIAPICVNTESDGTLPGSAGKAVPDTVIEIVDIQTGREVLPIGETGEIRVKGPHIMTEYSGQPEETAATLRDGFVYTGDIGHLDADGFLVISDRKKDVIFVKGFNVFPREIEEALMSHSSVSGACVVGRPDDRSGERPLAFVTLSGPTNEETLAEHCVAHLADYKLPAEIRVMENLPLTPAGKVDRMALRKEA